MTLYYKPFTANYSGSDQSELQSHPKVPTFFQRLRALQKFLHHSVFLGSKRFPLWLRRDSCPSNLLVL